MPDSALRAIPALWSLACFLRPYCRRIVAAVAALVLTAGILLSIGQGLRLLIDEGFMARSAAHLNQASLLILILTSLLALGIFARFYLVSWLGERVSADLRQAVFEHVIDLHPSFFETNRSGEIMSRLTTDTTLLQSIVGSSLSMALRSILTFAGALVMLLVTNLNLTLMVLVCVPFVLAPIFLYGRKVRALSRQSQASIADVGSYAGEVIQNIKTVQSFTREKEERNAFQREVEQAFSVARRRILQRGLLIAAVILLVSAGLTGMLWVGGRNVLAGEMTAGELGAFAFYATLVASASATLSEVYGELQRAAGACERLLELLAVESVVTEPEVVHWSASALAAEVMLDNVTFSYPSRPKQPALQDFSLTIEYGKSLALVGPSGAGKSTVFELLQRFYDPQQGCVLLGGVDVRELAPKDLRRQMALVPQQPALFTASLAHNIRYGKPDASDEEVMAAARAAHAHEFIEALPEGYQTHLGEQGVRLSGGQRQRIAIARAILKNPRVLLLDEATSALDSESERHVQLALQELMRDRTTVIIAHRLSTILDVHRIAVLDHGRLVASGDHVSLLSSSGLYRRLAQLQFRDENGRSDRA